MSAFDEAAEFLAEDRAAWRAWLETHHATVRGVWLATWRAGAGRPVLDYDAAVEEALCFGWIDSRAGGRDAQRSRLFFSPRKATSAWSASNKARIERLTAAGLMHSAGLAVVERARASGSWTLLDSVERLEVPSDLMAAFEAAGPAAAAGFAALPPSARKMALGWIALAKRAETRAGRIAEVAAAAARGERIDDRGR